MEACISNNLINPPTTTSWSSSACWLDIGFGSDSISSLPGHDDDVVFDIGSFYERISHGALDQYYLVLAITQIINIRKFTVVNSGLSPLNCTSSWFFQTKFPRMNFNNIPFFTLQIQSHGALNVESISTKTSCMQYFMLQIFEYGLLNLRNDSLIDTLVLNWGSLTADHPGIQLGVFVLELGCGAQNIPQISNLSVHSISRNYADPKFQTMANTGCDSVLDDSIPSCFASFNHVVSFSGCDQWFVGIDLHSYVMNADLIDIQNLVSSIIVHCPNGLYMASSSIAANTNSAIFIGSRAGDITGSNCSLHSSGTIIFAERRGRVRWHIRIRCDIEGCQLKEL